MTDPDRLLEQVEAAKKQNLRSAWVSIDTIIGLIERVKELEGTVENRYDKHTEIIARLEARLRAAEEVVEAVRQVNEPLPKDWSVDETAWTWAHERFVEGLQDALRRYDKAVKE